MMKKFWKKIRALSKWKILSAVAVFIVLLLLFRACNGPIIAPPKTYQIIRSNDWEPLELFGKEPNMGAFIDELVSEIAQQQNLRLYLSTVDNLDLRGMFQILDSGHYDAILVTFTPNAFLKDKYLISDPIYNAGPVLIVTESSTAKSLKDLNGKAIGVKRGSSIIFQLSQESSLLIPYDNMIQALDDLEKNIIGGVVMDAEIAQIYTHGFYQGRLKVATSPLTDLGLRLVAKKSTEEEYLIQHFNEGLEESEKNGSLEHLITRWGLTNP